MVVVGVVWWAEYLLVPSLLTCPGGSLDERRETGEESTEDGNVERGAFL